LVDSVAHRAVEFYEDVMHYEKKEKRNKDGEIVNVDKLKADEAKIILRYNMAQKSADEFFAKFPGAFSFLSEFIVVLRNHIGIMKEMLSKVQTSERPDKAILQDCRMHKSEFDEYRHGALSFGYWESLVAVLRPQLATELNNLYVPQAKGVAA